ncbi:MAG: ATP-binding cassette domain-containing protein, partial [Acidimicrobiia bacterium]|nr:ATP-binding cassette domain-containing protein [Acidimicrobiia bacterium]
MSADSATDHHAQLFDAPRIQVAGVVHRGNFRRAFDLTINEPRTAIVGPNGVGKSTLLRLIAGLECLASGLLKIDGKVVDDADNETSFVPTHQRGVALAFQDHRLFPHLRVLDNVAYPLRRAGARRAVAREQAARVVE